MLIVLGQKPLKNAHTPPLLYVLATTSMVFVYLPTMRRVFTVYGGKNIFDIIKIIINIAIIIILIGL